MSASPRRRQNGADFPAQARRSGFRISWVPLEHSSCFARAVRSMRLKWSDTVWLNLWFRETAFARKWMPLIASNGPLATRGTKRIVKLREAAGSRAARGLSDALRSALEFSQDVDEGIAAARERRK